MPRTAQGPRDLELNAPDDWGRDPLSDFLTTAWRNTVTTYAVDRDRYDVLAEIDAMYRRLIGSLGESGEQLAGAMAVRSHSSLLGATSLALAGQVAEAYVVLTSALEAAARALFVAGDAGRQKLWTCRHDDDAARAQMAKEFSPENIGRHLRSVDSATAAIYETLVERTTDRGAHPNTYANLSRNGAAGAPEFHCELEYFVVSNDVQRSCLRSTAQTGICCLSMLYHAFADIYRAHGLDESLVKLRRGH